MIWAGKKNELDQFFTDLNKKHPSVKFDYKASKERIVFLNTEIYLHNGKLHTKIYRKETDRQIYLHIKSEHPKSLKDQAIQIKQISSNQVDLKNSLQEMKNNFVKQGYHSLLINENLDSISLLNRIDLITGKNTRQKPDRIPLIITYN